MESGASRWTGLAAIPQLCGVQERAFVFQEMEGI